jgi:hypothetical protein
MPHGVEMSDFTYNTISNHGGKVLNKYCQADDSRLKFNAVPGWCTAMAVHWIAKQKASGDFFSWLQTDGGAASLRFVMSRQQNIVFQATTQQAAKGTVDVAVDDDYKRRTVEALKRQGVTLDHVYEADVEHSFHVATDCLYSTPGDYGVVHFTKIHGGGHTIAARRIKGGGMIVMDPNFGEISFNRKADVTGFLDEVGNNPGLGYLPLTRVIVEKYQ